MLVGNNIEQKLPLIIGEKRTASPRSSKAGARLLGLDYAVISQSRLVTKSQSSTHHDSETWSIRGRRYVAISETDTGLTSTRPWSRTSRRVDYGDARPLPGQGEPDAGHMDDHHQRERGAERREVGRRNWTACDQDPQRPSLDLWEVNLALEDKILQNEAESVLASLVAGCPRRHQLRSETAPGSTCSSKSSVPRHQRVAPSIRQSSWECRRSTFTRWRPVHPLLDRRPQCQPDQVSQFSGDGSGPRTDVAPASNLEPEGHHLLG